METDNKKTFLIINLSYFGDVLLTNTLCQNLKKVYPDSKIVFLVNTPFYEAAKFQLCVDDVICFDKRHKNRGILGLLKFIFNCPYRNKIDTAFIIYGNDRGILISYLLGCKRRISGPTQYTKYFLTDIHRETDGFKNMQDINGNFIKAITHNKGDVLPICYQPDETISSLIPKLRKLYKGQDIVSLCTTSKNKEKDMPVKTAVEIVEKLTRLGKTVFYLGAGAEARKFADDMKKSGCVNFVDLTNITSINELALVLKMSNSLISVDTGTMHLACAVQVPVVCVFYRQNTISKWAPRESMYKSVIIDRDYSSDYILKKLEALDSLVSLS